MKSLLIISFSELSTDSRVRRQINLFKDKYRTTVVGLDHPGIEGIEFIRANPDPRNWKWQLKALLLLGFRFYERFYWSAPTVRSARDQIGRRNFDFYIANDPSSLPLLVRLSENRPLLYDAHEYAPEKLSDDLRWRLLMKPHCIYLMRKYLPRTSVALTVSTSIANAYERNFRKRMITIMNAPSYYALQPSKTNRDSIRLVHQGNAIRRRKLELMIDLVEQLDNRFTLDFILKPSDSKYLSDLKVRSKENQRINFLPPQSPKTLVKSLNDYDMGIYIMPPVNFNMANALPNKLFEFIQARLGIAVGPTPEMALIVRQYEMGVVADDFSPSSLAKELNQLTLDDVLRFKENAALAAKEINYECEASKLLSVFESMINPRP